MRFKRLLALTLSIVIVANSALPAFATELASEEVILEEEVSMETDEEALESEEIFDEVDSSSEDVLTILEEENDETLEFETVILEETFIETMNADGMIASGYINNDKGGISWNIDKNYKLWIYGKGELHKESEPEGYHPWEKYWDKIQSVYVNLDDIKNLHGLFSDCPLAREIDLRGLDTSQVTDMSKMFASCALLTEIDLSGFDTSQVTDMSSMFSNCLSLRNLDVRGFDTGQVTDMYRMFYGCENLTKLDVSGFDTSQVRDMEGMFKKCRNLTELDLSRFNLSKLAYADEVFYFNDYLQLIKTPIRIPVNRCIGLEGDWYSSDGTKWTYLPQGLEKSIVLQKGSIPTEDSEPEDVPSEEVITPEVKEGELFYCDNDLAKVLGKKKKPLKIKYHYEDSWFLENSSGYNHELAKMSIRTAVAGFNANTNEANGDNAYYIKKLMDDLGYVYDDNSIQYPDPNKWTIGYAIGSKDISSDTSVLMVTVRGGGYKGEWYSNCIVGENGDHQGFDEASIQVGDGIYAYINEHANELKKNVKVWIVGYSRASAVANLTAADLCNGFIEGISPEDVFAYCFACPQGTVDSNAASNKYSSIKNIVNPIDLVTKVAMDAWDFTRYGVTYYLPYAGGSKDYLNDKSEMRIKYDNILSYNGLDNIEERTKAVLALTTESPAQAITYKDIVDELACLVGNRRNYVNKLVQGDVAEAAYKFMGKQDVTADTWMQIILSLSAVFNKHNMAFNLPGILKQIVSVGEMYALQHPGESLEGVSEQVSALSTLNIAHYPALYMAWLDSLDGSNKNYNGKYLKVYINCPVNVTVYDEDNNIVGEIVNDEVVNNKDGCTTYVDQDGQKIVVLPSDAEYEIQMTATDNGTVTYTVEECNLEEENSHYICSYYDTNVENGSVLTGVIMEKEDASAYKYMLLNSLGEKIEPTKELVGEEIATYSIYVKAEGPGSVNASSQKREGEYAILNAIPDDDASFLGWYDGETLISSEENYRFRVEADVSLIAKFTSNHLHKITYYNQNEELDLEPKYFLDNEQTNLPILSEEGKIFDGWKISTDSSDECMFILEEGVYEDICLYASWTDITQFEEYAVENIKDQVYSGTVITPKPRVYDETKLLTLGKDYTLAYKNNTKVGIAQVIVKGKGNYTKTMTIKFEIVPKELSDEDILITCADKLYNGKKQVSKPTIKWGKKTLKSGIDYTVAYSADQTSAGIVDVTIEGKGDYCGRVETSYRITDKDIAKALMDKIAAQYYTGEEIEPEIILYADKSAKAAGETLDLGIDYSLVYANNINAGKGTLIITGLGAYGGSKTVTFTISKRNIGSEEISFNALNGEKISEYSVTYNGSALKPKLLIMDGEQILEEGKDYKLTYSNTTNAANVDSKTKPTITVTGLGNYTGSKKLFFNIASQNISDAEGLEVKVDDAKYTGKVVKPKVTVACLGKNLKNGTDYKITGYYNNIDFAEKDSSNAPYVTIEGLKNFSGTIDVKFRIYELVASSFVVDKIQPQVYTPHEAIEPEVCVYASKEMQSDGNMLLEGIDYEITSYDANEKAGTGKVTVTGIGQYGGSKTVTFIISKRNLLTENIDVDVSDLLMTYTGSALKPAFKIMDGEFELTEGVDYTVSYSNNKTVPKNNKTVPTIVIKGKGNYTGTIKEAFEIVPKQLSAEGIVITAKEVLFNQKTVNNIKGMTTTVTVMDGSKKLSTSDYKIMEYKNNRSLGEINGEDAPIVVLGGSNNYTGTVEIPFRIYQNDISEATVAKIPNELYTGKEVEPMPVVTLKLSKTETITLVPGEDYTVSYDKNVKIGKAKVIITGIGEFGGSKSVSFTILPKWLKWFL